MANDLWRTPPEVFGYFDRKYSFECDVAASDGNHLCNSYFTETLNALTYDWAIPIEPGQYIWCNPPYSNPLPWAEKCIIESKTNGIGSVILLNHDMSTKWASELLSIKCKIIVLTGKRIAFLNSEGQPVKGNSKGQVLFVIPPYVRDGSPYTEYIELNEVMLAGNTQQLRIS